MGWGDPYPTKARGMVGFGGKGKEIRAGTNLNTEAEKGRSTGRGVTGGKKRAL